MQFFPPPGTEVGRWGARTRAPGPRPGGLTFTRGKPGGQVRGAKPGRRTIHLVKSCLDSFSPGDPQGARRSERALCPGKKLGFYQGKTYLLLGQSKMYLVKA